MKTSVELDEAKIREAKKLTGEHTLKALLDRALDDCIARAKRLSMLEVLESAHFDGDLKTMRQSRGRSR